MSGPAAAFVLAIVLPFLAAGLTARITILHSLPFALHFIAMAVVATLGGFGPGLVSVLVTVLTRYVYLPVPGPQIDPKTEVLRVSVLIASALVISLTTRRLRQTSMALEMALATLQEQTDALIQAQQASKCASWTYDARDKIRWIAGSFEVFGVPFSRVEELPSLFDLIHEEDRARVRRAFDDMITSRVPMHIEYRTLWPNNEIHWSELRGNPLPNDEHACRGVTFDITERKLAEAALIRQEKLAAMGRLASTVAHEINNPLEAVTNLLYLAREDASSTPDTQDYLATAEKELARLGNITRLTLGFVRNSALRSDVDVAEVVEDVLSIFHHRLEMKNVVVERDYQGGVLIGIAPHELRQIVVNLVSNAADAISAADTRVAVRVRQEEDRAVLLVEDKGCGISEQHLQRIFDPFFSTKNDVGTGIGLWVTRELVESNGGSISARSGNLPNGYRTCFRVEFPISHTVFIKSQQVQVRPEEPSAVS